MDLNGIDLCEYKCVCDKLEFVKFAERSRAGRSSRLMVFRTAKYDIILVIIMSCRTLIE